MHIHINHLRMDIEMKPCSRFIYIYHVHSERIKLDPIILLWLIESAWNRLIMLGMMPNQKRMVINNCLIYNLKL